jgi:hypothetical protein
MTAYNKAFASVGVKEKCETNGKLINFMVGVRRAGSLKPGRCKAPNRLQTGFNYIPYWRNERSLNRFLNYNTMFFGCVRVW